MGHILTFVATAERMLDLMCGPIYTTVARNTSCRNARGWHKWPMRLIIRGFLEPLADECYKINPHTFFTKGALHFYVIHAMLAANDDNKEHRLIWDLQTHDIYANMNRAHIITLSVRINRVSGYFESFDHPLSQRGLDAQDFILGEDEHSLWPVLPKSNGRLDDIDPWMFLISSNKQTSDELFCFFAGCVLLDAGIDNVRRHNAPFMFLFEEHNLAWVGDTTEYFDIPFSFFFKNKDELLTYMVKLDLKLGLSYIQKFSSKTSLQSETNNEKKYFANVDIHSIEEIKKYLRIVGLPSKRVNRCAKRWKPLLSRFTTQFIHAINYGKQINWPDFYNELLDQDEIPDTELAAFFQENTMQTITPRFASRLLDSGFYGPEFVAHCMRMRCFGTLSEFNRKEMAIPPNLGRSLLLIAKMSSNVMSQYHFNSWTSRFLNDHSPVDVERNPIQAADPVITQIHDEPEANHRDSQPTEVHQLIDQISEDKVHTGMRITPRKKCNEPTSRQRLWIAEESDDGYSKDDNGETSLQQRDQYEGISCRQVDTGDKPDDGSSASRDEQNTHTPFLTEDLVVREYSSHSQPKSPQPRVEHDTVLSEEARGSRIAQQYVTEGYNQLASDFGSSITKVIDNSRHNPQRLKKKRINWNFEEDYAILTGLEKHGSEFDWCVRTQKDAWDLFEKNGRSNMQIRGRYATLVKMNALSFDAIHCLKRR
jgi:hypothetical protein